MFVFSFTLFYILKANLRAITFKQLPYIHKMQKQDKSLCLTGSSYIYLNSNVITAIGTALTRQSKQTVYSLNSDIQDFS